MAKRNIVELGVVKTIYDSGIVETNQGIRSMIRANFGDRLVKDVESGVVEIAPKKTRAAKTAKAIEDKKTEDNILDIKVQSKEIEDENV